MEITTFYTGGPVTGAAIAGSAGEKTIRIDKSVQQIRMVRTSPLSVAIAGLLLGLPERISVEVNHPTRRRIQPALNVSLAHYAAWAHYGRNHIVEYAPAVGLENPLFGILGTPLAGGQTIGPDTVIDDITITTELNIFIGDGGPLELLADDQATLVIRGLLSSSKYEIFNPDQPVLPANAQEYISMERALILEDTVSKNLPTAGFQGIILPNDQAAIEQVIIDYNMGDNRTEQARYKLDELMDAQDDVNPHFAGIYYDGPKAADKTSFLPRARNADLLVLDFKHITNVELITVLGKRVEYTMVRVADRNAA